jgi:hypothetical protein
VRLGPRHSERAGQSGAQYGECEFFVELIHEGLPVDLRFFLSLRWAEGATAAVVIDRWDFRSRGRDHFSSRGGNASASNEVLLLDVIRVGEVHLCFGRALPCLSGRKSGTFFLSRQDKNGGYFIDLAFRLPARKTHEKERAAFQATTSITAVSCASNSGMRGANSVRAARLIM